jgi:subtilase family serine protease
VVIAHSTHPLARPEYDQGPVDDGLPMDHMVLILKSSPQQESQLQTLLDRQQTKGSPYYHQWLTPDEFGEMFGPPTDEVDQVRAWLEGQGFSVGQTPHGRRWLDFSGTASQVENAFQTQIHQYQVDGISHISNASDISIPASLASIVLGIASLNDFFKRPPQPVSHYQIQAVAHGRATIMTPDTNLTINGVPSHALAPGDFARIYNLSPLYASGQTGSGETIAVVAQSNIQPTDLQIFRDIFSLPTNLPKIIINPSSTDPGITSDQDEATFDTEWTGAVAPNATIDVVVSSPGTSTPAIALSSMYIVDTNLAGIMSLSFSICENSGQPLWSPLWEQAAAQGISVIVSSGDTGAFGCDSKSATVAQEGLYVNGIASTPYNTAVGGTEFNENGNDSAFWSDTNGPGFVSVFGYIPEEVWNEYCNQAVNSSCPENGLWASGGGTSGIYPKPNWQLPSLTAAVDPTWRDVPDISLPAASHDGHIFCSSQNADSTCTLATGGSGLSFEHAGIFHGTSAAAPAFAGIMAIIDQKNGGRQGLPNYILYQLAATEYQSANNLAACNSSVRTNPNAPAPAQCIFYDITEGNNAVPCQAESPGCPNGGTVGYSAGPGYDLATGLGSLNAANLANAWTSTTFPGSTPPFQFSGTSTTTVNAGDTATFTLSLNTGDGFAGAISLKCSPAPCTVSSGGSSIVYATGAPSDYPVTVSVPTSRQTLTPIGNLPTLLWLSVVTLVTTLCLLSKRRRLVLIALAALVTIAGLTACTSARAISTVTVTGTSGAVSNSITLTLTIIE